MDLQVDPQAIKSGFDALKGAIDTVKSLRDLFKSKPEAGQELDEQIKRAERQVALAEAQLAQALGYKLCKAHFPPVPMLKNRAHAKYVEEIAKCPECGNEEPSPEYFSQKELFDQSIANHNSRVSSEYDWMSR